ncbi:PREDICTED: calcium-binding tyrosine phosphorylation-regulated protein isoform X1 [Condylura cristata]|uniref:calcium-binding tyrosine phosphorylation-regulated protein isoform X1 n=1 Tax=Condylura cristata TaxID=143302 RepID=UPI0006431B23|nr:PREDICTED: calcium-binding tyrosine phosphorylation-regulated protein isoform X1 [Condylura cristata]
MISSKPRLVVPYGLKTLLEGVSRAVLKTNPPNITQFAAVYFKELIVFREGNNNLDIKDLVKQFHQIKIERWAEGTTQEKKSEYVKEPEGISAVSQEPKRVEKSTDTEEDNITGPQFINKTTQFPSVHTELSESEEMPEAVRGPSKSSTPKESTPPSSPPPAAVSSEFAYVPADPSQFAAQMLGNVSSIHSNQSEILMVDVATSMPTLSEEVLSQRSVYVDLGSKPKDNEPTPAFSSPLQDEQEPPAYDHAPKVSLQADVEVTSTVHISSIYKDEPVTEGVVYVQQKPGQIDSPSADDVCGPNENEKSPISPRSLSGKRASAMSERSVGPAIISRDSVQMEAIARVMLSDTSHGQPAQFLDAVGSGNTGQEESWEHSAPQEMEASPVLSEEAAEAAYSGASVRSSSGPTSPIPEGLFDPELEPDGEATPEQGLVEPAIAASEAGQPPPYSNMWTLYCLTDMNQQSRPSPPPAPGPFPQATLYLSNPKDPQFLQPPPKVTSPTYVMMDDSKKTSAPPFILVGSNVQEAQDWKPLPGHPVVSQADALKRYAAVQVPIAVPADQKFQKQTPNSQNACPPSGQDVPRPQSPVFLSVAFPVEDVAKKGSGSGDKRTPFGSYGIAGEITVTSAHVRRAES